MVPTPPGAAGDPALPALSVVIPTYQRADTVGRAIASVLAQRDCPAYEVIVVDDGSTDDTTDVLAGIGDPRVRVVRQANAGRSAARNAGVEVARAPVVTFLDSDDEALPGWLAEIARRLGEAPLVRLGVLRDRGGGEIERIPGAPLPADRPFPTGACQAGSFAVARDLFRAVGGFDPNLEFAENTDLLIRLALASRREGWTAAWTKEPGVVLHEQGTGARTARYASAPAHSAEVMLQRYRDELRHDRRVRRDYLAVLGTGELRAGHRIAALGAFGRAWWAGPTSPQAAARVLSVALPARVRSRISASRR